MHIKDYIDRLLVKLTMYNVNSEVSQIFQKNLNQLSSMKYINKHICKANKSFIYEISTCKQSKHRQFI